MSKVSIISPCFNAQAYIVQTYQCLQNQTHSNWEWIVTDDKSSDDSLRILNEIAKMDSRVKVITHQENQGAAASRNSSLNNANGDYIAFLDIDDLWKSEKLKLQIEFMKKKNLSVSHHDYKTIDANGSFIKHIKTPTLVTADSILKFNPFATSSLMMTREIIESNAIRFKEHLRRRQDYIFWYQTLCACEGSICFQESLSSYRIFGNDSLSADKKKMAQIQWMLLRDEFDLTPTKRVYYFICYAIHGIKKYFL